MDVRTQMLVFPRFATQDVRANDPRMSADVRPEHFLFGLFFFFFSFLKTQGGSGTELEPETGTVGTIFPKTESGAGTAGTVFQKPKAEP